MVILQQIAYRVMFMEIIVLGLINLQGNMTVHSSFEFEGAPKLCECPEEK